MQRVSYNSGLSDLANCNVLVTPIVLSFASNLLFPIKAFKMVVLPLPNEPIVMTVRSILSLFKAVFYPS